MGTIRRMYFYGLALLSVLVVVWGVVNLLRTMLTDLVGSGSLLATGLSLILVGLPIFLLHWWVAQRDAARDMDERSSRIRAVFLYAVQGATLGAVVYAVLALLDRLAVFALGLPPERIWFGEDGRAIDNAIAWVVNAVAFAYFWRVLQAEWKAIPNPVNLVDTRRLYRYLWLIAGLILAVTGSYNLLRFLFSPDLTNDFRAALLAGGLAMLAVGAPVLVYTWRLIQASLIQPVERDALLRLLILYIISLAGVVGVLSLAGSILNLLVRWILGEPYTLAGFLSANDGQLGGLIPVSLMWWYFGGVLNREVAAITEQPRRTALRRLYYYILSGLGLAVTFAGLISLVTLLARQLFTIDLMDGFSFRDQLSGSLSSLLVGLPLWLLPWHMMQSEARNSDDAGDHARRSLLRKVYLYLVLFAMVVGAMTFTGQLLYTLFDQLFNPISSNDFVYRMMESLFSLIVVVVLLGYHLQALRKDGQIAQQTLGNLHAAFPVLVLIREEADVFAPALVQALQRVAPALPVRVLHLAEEPVDVEPSRALVIPLDVAVNPPTPWAAFVQQYEGRRLVVPVPVQGWDWLGQEDKELPQLARETAQTLRQMAEGEAIHPGQVVWPGGIAGYILGGLAGLVVLAVLFSIMISALFR